MQCLTDLLVAYLTGVLPVHGVDGGSRVHVHQVVVVVAGHHAAAPVVELHGEAGVGGDGPHGVGVVATPPCDPEAGPPEGGRTGARRLPSPPPSPHVWPCCQSSAAPTMCRLGCSPVCSLETVMGGVLAACWSPPLPAPRPLWSGARRLPAGGLPANGEPSARAPIRPTGRPP